LQTLFAAALAVSIGGIAERSLPSRAISVVEDQSTVILDNALGSRRLILRTCFLQLFNPLLDCDFFSQHERETGPARLRQAVAAFTPRPTAAGR
jgi:hypothetical protein